MLINSKLMPRYYIFNMMSRIGSTTYGFSIIQRIIPFRVAGFQRRKKPRCTSSHRANLRTEGWVETQQAVSMKFPHTVYAPCNPYASHSPGTIESLWK